MKKVLFIALILISALAKGQIYQTDPSFGKTFNRANAEKILTIPGDTILDGSINPCRQIARRGDTLYMYSCELSHWISILSTNNTAVSLDSAVRSNDTLYFRRTNGGVIAVSMNGIQNQYAGPQNARAWIDGHLRADSGIVVKRKFTGLGDKVGVNVEDSTTGGNLELGNSTFISTQFMPYIAGTIRYDSTNLGLSFNRALYLLGRYYAVDTTGRSNSDKNFILSAGGVNIASRNLNDATNGRISKQSNLFSVTKTLSPTALKYSMRIGGDDNTQFAGKLAVGYPFAFNDTTADDLMTYMQRFKSGQALKVNGRATASAAVDTNDLVIKRQLDDWQNFQITSLLSEAAVPIQPSDSVVTALGKLQAQINNGGGASLQSATAAGNTTTLSASFGSSIVPFKSVHAWTGIAFSDSSYLTGSGGIIKAFTKTNSAGAVQTGSLAASSTYAITQPAAGSAYIQNQLMVGNTVPLRGAHINNGVALDDSSYLRGNSGPNPYTSFLTNSNAAQTVKMGGLVVASSFATVPPTNGAYIQGNVGINVTGSTRQLHVSGTTRLDLGSDAKWDMAYRDSATGNLARLAAGTTGQILQSGFGGKPQWSNASSVAILNQNTSAQSGNFWITGTGRADSMYASTFRGNAFLTGNDSTGLLSSSTGIVQLRAYNKALAVLGYNGKSYMGINTFSPNSALHIMGSMAITPRGFDSSITFSDQYYSVYANNDTNIVYTLPLASTCPGRIYEIKKTKLNSALVIISPFASTDSIDHRWRDTLFAPGESVRLQAYGNYWQVLSRTNRNQNISAVTFSPVASTNDILGTGYSVSITGVANRMNVSITTGTGITSSGTIGNLVMSLPFASTPVTVYSASDVNTIGAPVGFNATSSNTIIIFSTSTLLSPSRTYSFNLISTL
ncbi:hypothetical protein [Chitinophaga sp.]|uniref:hypothetical protein n=1 Tax=Chitinophaga sp. TaxID=1869181 RepID=UPI0031CE8690